MNFSVPDRLLECWAETSTSEQLQTQRHLPQTGSKPRDIYLRPAPNPETSTSDQLQTQTEENLAIQLLPSSFVVFQVLLSSSLVWFQDTEEYEHLTYTCALWDALIESAKIEHTSCENTRIFWEASPAKLVDSLRGKGRRLIRESKTNPLTLYNAGRFAAHWFFLFSDIFVHSHVSW
jgi:hypothetical protein